MAATSDIDQIPESDTEGEEDCQQHDPQETDENEQANTVRPSTRAFKARRSGLGEACLPIEASPKLPLKRKVHPEEESKNAVQRLTSISKEDQSVTIHCNSGRVDKREHVFNFHTAASAAVVHSWADIVRSVKVAFGIEAKVKILKARTQEEATLEDLTTNKYHEHFVLKVNNTVDFDEFKEELPSLPHQDLHDTLAKGNYTVLISKCELIDNSVQATSANTKEQGRHITISVQLAAAQVKISDNGSGWDVPSEFSSLGYGTHQRASDDAAPPPQTRNLRDHFSGNVSRYGVGGKFAEALLGNRFTLETKVKGDVGYSVSFGKRTHYKFEKHTWSAAARHFAPDHTFSSITVEEVDVSLFTQCQRANPAVPWYTTLANDFRKIYFPYLQLEGAGGELKMGALRMFERWTALLENTRAWSHQPAAAGSGKGAGRKRKKGEVSVASGFAGVDAAHAALLDQLRRATASSDQRASAHSLVGLDLELRVDAPVDTVIRVGSAEVKCRWDFIFGPAACDCFPVCFELPNSAFPSRKSTVRIFVAYFGHKSASETGDGEPQSLQRVLERDRSVDGKVNPSRAGYFWNGRYLPLEALEPEFMRASNAPKGQQKALARCYSRAFAVVLLDRHFQVQLNKQALDQNSAMYTALQERMKEPELCKAFAAYIQGCNTAHDDEVRFSPNEDGRAPVFNESTHRTTHFHALVEQKNYKEDDKVAFWKKSEEKQTEKNMRVGIVECFEQDGNEEEGGVTGTVLIREAVGQDTFLPVEHHRLNRVTLDRLTAQKFQAKVKELAKILPVSLAWEEKPDEFEAGIKLANLAVACLSAVPKSKTRCFEVPAPKLTKCKVDLKVSGPGLEVPRVFPLELKRDGRFTLERGVVQDDDDATPLLTKVGTYKFVFSLDNGVLAPCVLEEDVEVVSDAATTMELANEAVLAEAMQMGQELPPLRFTLLDAFQNPLSLRGRSVTVHNVFAHTGTLDIQRAKAKEVDGQCEVTGLKLESGPMGEWSVRVELAFSHISTGHTQTTVRVKVDHGPPVSISRVLEPGAAGFLMSLTNLQECPVLEFELRDSSGNVCTNFDGWAVLTCPAVPDGGRCRVAQGRASFASGGVVVSPVFSYATGSLHASAPSAKKNKEARRSVRGSGNKGSEFEVVKPKNKDINGIFLGDNAFFCPNDTVLLQVQHSADEPAVLKSIGTNSHFEVERLSCVGDGEVQRRPGLELMRPENDNIGCIRGRAFVFGSRAQYDATSTDCRGKHVYWTDDAALDTAGAVPCDVFLFETQNQPKRADLENVRLHERFQIAVHASGEPVAAAAVRECREAADGGHAYLPVNGLVQGKPQSEVANLQLQVTDETGTVLCARRVTEGATMTLSWASGALQDLQYSEDGGRILLPCLQVSDSHAREEYWVELHIPNIPRVNWVVITDAGDPAKLEIDAAGKHAVGKDTSFQLTVADIRGSELAPQEAGEDWELDILDMVVWSDEEKFASPVQVRKENFHTQNYKQEYTTEEKPVAKLYKPGVFYVEHVRLPGTAGPVRIDVTASLTVTGAALQDGASMADQDNTQVYKLAGSFGATLEAGPPTLLAVRGYKSPHGSGSQGSSSISIAAKSHAPVERIVVDFVDECNNKIQDSTRALSFVWNKGAAKFLAGVNTERLELQPHLDGYLLEDVVFTKVGTFSGHLQVRSGKRSVEDLKVEFKVGPSDRVAEIQLEVAEKEVQVGGWATVLLHFRREDGSDVQEPSEESVTVHSFHDGHALESRRITRFSQNKLELSVKMPLQFPNDDPSIALGVKFEGQGDFFETSEDDAVIRPLRSGPFSMLTVARAGAMSVRQTQATQSSQSAPQPVLDEVERSLNIPDLTLTACDAHGNRCDDFEDAKVIIELSTDGGGEDLELEGETSFRLVQDQNPHHVQGLRAKLLRDVGIEHFDFSIKFRVTADRGIAACSEVMSYRSNLNSQEKVAQLETEESFRKLAVDEKKKEIKATRQKMQKLRIPPSEEEQEAFQARRQKVVYQRLAEIARREREEQGEAAKSTINFAANHKPAGLVGVISHVVSVAPHPRAAAFRDAMSAVCGSKLSSALFETEEALDAHKANAAAQRVCNLGRVYSIPRLREEQSKSVDGKHAPEGYVGLLADFADVDERAVPDESSLEAVRKLFRMVCGSTVVFETYRQAIAEQRRMAEQKKPARRAVGLDRPREVIDADGGQDLQSASREPSVRLAIRSFADSHECNQMRKVVHDTRAEIENFKARLEEHAKLQQQLRSQEQQRDAFADMLEEVRSQLSEARRHAERQY